MDEDPDLHLKLKEYGLDLKHWLPVFKHELGVTSPQALMNIGEESFGMLQQFVRKPWEKKALRKLLDMKDEESSFKSQRQKHREKLQKRQEESQQMLHQLKQLQNEGKDRHDEAVQRIEGGIREALQISPDAWIPSDTNLQTAIRGLESNIGELDGILRSREELDDQQMLRNASGGLALQGILLSRNLDDQMENRDQLLKPPSDIQLVGPSLSKLEKIEEFSSQHREDQFRKSMDKLGYSASASAKGGYGGFSAEVGGGYSRASESEVTNKHHQKELYSSTLKYSFVPLASSCFNDSQLLLSDVALRKLKVVEILITSKPKGSVVQDECQKFFKQFGSHACKGHLHFGGIYWRKSISKGFEKKDMETVKTLQRETVDMKASVSYGCFFGASAEANRSKVEASFRGRYSEDLISMTTLEVTATGGPPEVSNLPQWKSGLAASNSTWSLIDRGTSTVPVWDIIEMNHQKDFNNPIVLAQELRQAWHQLTKIHTDSSNTDLPIQEAENAAQAMVVIRTWDGKEEETTLTQHLSVLLSAKQDLVRRSMNLQAWSDLYLSQPPVQQYLRSVMESMEDSSSKDTGYVKLLMRQLVKPSDAHHVKDLADITEWLYHTNQSEAVVVLECTDIATLKMIIESNLEEMIVAKAKSSSLYEELNEQQDVKIQATALVAKAVNFLRDSFKEAKQKYEELFLVTLLFPCQYDVTDRIFRHLLSTSDLEYLKKELEVRSKEFGNESPIKLQAYLFNVTVKMYDREDVDVTATQVKRHLQYLQNELKSDLDPHMEHVLFQFRSSWKELRFQLDSLEKGVVLKKQGGNELLNLISESETTEPSPQSESTPISKSVPKVPSGKVQELFKKLGLLKHYPQQMTLQDALLVRQETLGNEQCTELELLPYFILQKLMMHDYQCRGVLFQNKTTSSSLALAKSSEPHDNFDDFDDFDDKPSSVSSSSGSASAKVHPMDGLLALFHSSDNFLRQDLMTRLSTCQLAIPFLLPNPFTHSLSLSLWAMRTIIKEWKSTDPKTGKSESGGSPIVSYPTPIISFCRFTSKRSQLFKSGILNEVITDSPHNYFFHFHCDGGSTDSLLMDGLVELCWYLPAGKPNDPFSQVITFSNLRGDALSHPEQTKFLSQVSYMNFVLLTEDNLDAKGIKILQDLAKAPGGVVLMFLDTEFTQKGRMTQLMKTIPKSQCFRMRLSGKSAADVKTSIREQINKRVTCSQVGFRTIEECAEVARGNGIVVDEDDPECVQGRALANEVQEELAKLQTSDKDGILPLQSRKYWHKWASHDKELHRHVNIGTKGLEQYNTEKEEDKLMIRIQQLTIAECPSPVMKAFLSNLLKHKGKVRDYFLQWLKFILDYYSRQKLPKLFLQYKQVRMQLLTLQRDKSGKEEAKKPLRDLLEELNEKLVHASFGLEHFLREIGQMYEATVEQKSVSPQLREQISHLPQVAAELLASGYPLELMDGDASHVPLCWVMAVLHKLSALLRNPRLFVLSVLGIQSTGKSTLLNTMFGLRFTVSAGRCTRGAFMQLLPLNESLRKETNCDYLLIIDTEGLRAPELSSQETQKHDNELATFVIGLANVTLINIFGETPGDMDDILQRAVHAFIRMEHVGLKPSCQFVHQNVGAVSGASRGMMGRVNFQEKLNKMTKAAAEEEGLGGAYTMFSDVIDFNEEKDVWYFPGLWKGDPPMAPVNLGYSDGAQQLKSGLIEITGFHRDLQCPLSTFQTRIQDLWEAILHENFIFSFKNTLEITAYNHLDAKYAQWSWEFQSRMSEWLKRARHKIGNTPIYKLGELKRSLESELSVTGTKIHEDLENERKKFFEEDEQHDILAQWQSRTEKRLGEVRIEQEADAKHQCDVLISARQALAKADTMKQSHRDQLLQLVKKLVSGLERGRLNDRELEQLYEQTWTQWMTELKSSQQIHPQSEPDIEVSLENCLKQKFHAHYNLLKPRLSKAPLKTRKEKSLKLEVIPDTHITANRVWDGFKKIWSTTIMAKLQQTHIDAAEKENKKFLKEAEEYLEEKRKGKGNFNLIFCHELLKTLLETIARVQKQYPEFTFTAEYKVDIALTVCGYANIVFEKMAEDFRRMNDPVEYLEREMKTPFLRLFKSQYYQTAQEKTAAYNLCDRLVKPIEEALKGSLAQMIAQDVRSSSSSFATKKALKARILIDLADKPSRYEYAMYLTDVEHSVQAWVKKYTIEYCWQSQGGKTKFTELAESELGRLVASISTAANEVTHQILKKWLVDFHRKLVMELPHHRDPGEMQKAVRDLKVELTRLDVSNIRSLDKYVKAVEQKVQAWVEVYTKQHSEPSPKPRLTETDLGRLRASISTAANKVTSTFPKALVQDWLVRFHNKLEAELTLNLREMQEVVGDLKDVKNFTEELCLKLADLSVKEFESLDDMDKWDERPYDIVFKALIGCCEQCPFCKEQCELTNPKHSGDKHSVSLHRSQCLGGWRWLDSNKMILETCNALVGSDRDFRYQEDGNWKFKPYSKFQDVHPSWTINADSSLEAASYWKWYVAHYTSDVVDLYTDMKSNEIPPAWRALQPDKVKEDLKELYNL